MYMEYLYVFINIVIFSYKTNCLSLLKSHKTTKTRWFYSINVCHYREDYYVIIICLLILYTCLGVSLSFIFVSRCWIRKSYWVSYVIYSSTDINLFIYRFKFYGSRSWIRPSLVVHLWHIFAPFFNPVSLLSCTSI